ncbi:hypothetical protein BU23DRAFT_518431 [Bimuria novae-zelandiae CBS 107.79]|uniref:RTA1-domain-containing protein n=1 Tax=Bimuria novae-zelandiae CBS 107.79 TaxID=1447943 RepID=A0A6A5UQU5_9PLEO|nr:hypothetical protein BU23DRAFT_518431 [Bimuria novae-zelandiae CBS 107.79]
MSAFLELLQTRHVQLPKREHSGRYGFNPFIYGPNVPAAAVGCVVIVLLSSLLVYQHVRYRSWFFWSALIGVLMEVIGYICRLISATDTEPNGPFIVAFLMILLAPSFLVAACYMAFSRVVWFSCPTHALNFKTLWCFPRWITPTFVTFDLFSFVVQLAGASTISRHYDHDTSPDRSIESVEQRVLAGRVILILGLILQLSCYMAFAIIAMRYFVISLHWRHEDLGDFHMFRRLSYFINIAAGLITLRAIYRTLEIPQDKSTGLQYLQQHEWCFWSFDTVPVVLVLVVMAIWHPGKFLPRSYTGLVLDKTRAVQEKDALRPTTPVEETELRTFTPKDFQPRAPVILQVRKDHA